MKKTVLAIATIGMLHGASAEKSSNSISVPNAVASLVYSFLEINEE